MCKIWILILVFIEFTISGGCSMLRNKHLFMSVICSHGGNKLFAVKKANRAFRDAYLPGREMRVDRGVLRKCCRTVRCEIVKMQI